MIKKIMRGIWLLIFLMATGCGNPYDETEPGRDDSQSQNTASGNASEDIASGNEIGDQTDEDVSQNRTEEIEVIELSNGLYAYLSTDASLRDQKIDGITEWIMIQARNPETGLYNEDFDSDYLRPGTDIHIPNVYGNITDICMDDYSQICICYEDAEGKTGQAVIPIDFYTLEGNVIEPINWASARVLSFDEEELLNETVLPKEVWCETFVSGGKEYTAVYSRISPMYEYEELTLSDMSQRNFCLSADYQLVILQNDEIVYEAKLYQMKSLCEEIHYMEDVNGDGTEDFILLNYEIPYTYGYIPYIFVWDPEQETCCISGGGLTTEERAAHEGWERGKVAPYFWAVGYDRDSRIFYDFSKLRGNGNYYTIYGMVTIFGAQFIDGEWKTVYELYLGEKGADYAIEIKYDAEGNVISETRYTEMEHRNLADSIYTGCELLLYESKFYPDYLYEQVIINKQYSYWKFVRNEE